jgi:hypothetical protein
MIKRRDSRTEFLGDTVEKEARIALLTFFAIRAQVDDHDVPDHPPDLNILDTVLPEYVQNASSPVGVLNSLNPPGHSYLPEALLAGQEPIRGIHEGDAAARGGHAADIDAPRGERAHDDGRLMAGLFISQIVIPRNCTLPEI